MTDAAKALQYQFADRALLEEALTHRSAGRPNNERLEFLGDAVLAGVVSEALFARHPKASEGELTRWRAQIVREGTLAAIARELDLGDRVLLGPGELKSGGFRRDSILADALEAVIGAIYLDGGWDAARSFVLRIAATRMDSLSDQKPPKDPKTRLQEWVQARAIALPRYELLGSHGEEHDKIFFASCEVPALGLRVQGEGASRRAAETAAAEAAMAQLSADDSRIGVAR